MYDKQSSRIQWRCVDWSGKIMFGGKTFNTFGDARAAIAETAKQLYATEAEREAYEEDVYAELCEQER